MFSRHLLARLNLTIYKQLFDSRASSIEQLCTSLNSLCALKPKRKKTDTLKLCIIGTKVGSTENAQSGKWQTKL